MEKIVMIAFFIFVSMLDLSAAELDNRVKYESQSHKDRIAILEEADKCIKNAKTKEDYKICEENEKQARKSSRQNIFEMRKATILEKMAERKSNSPENRANTLIEKVESCVKNAKNGKELKICFNRLGD